jgi:hypothetical protein
VAAATAVPTVGARCRGLGMVGELEYGQGKVEEGSVGLAAGRNPELAAAASNGADGGSGRGRWAREDLALWRLLYSGSVPPCCAEWRMEDWPRAVLGGRAGSTDGQSARACERDTRRRGLPRPSACVPILGRRVA